MTWADFFRGTGPFYVVGLFGVTMMLFIGVLSFLTTEVDSTRMIAERWRFENYKKKYGLEAALKAALKARKRGRYWT